VGCFIGDALASVTYEELEASHKLQDELRELKDKLADERQKVAASILFDDLLRVYENKIAGNRDILSFCK
jgi:uncharacterized membrane-anchored protein YhcB (DUF1043 family)